MKTQSFDQN